MEIQDFSSGFDTLLNSYAYSANSGMEGPLRDIKLDEFEKSQFLTKAQEEIVLSLYTGRNSSFQSFEETEELRRYLSDLVREETLSPNVYSDKPHGVDSRSVFFTLPPTLWFITYENVTLIQGKCAGHTSMQVVPVTQDEYHKIRKDPFRGANDHRALRLDLSGNFVEIICKYPIKEYAIRYIVKPTPILLTSLRGEGLQLEGLQDPQNCQLHEALHQRILEKAVLMALQSKGHVMSTSQSN